MMTSWNNSRELVSVLLLLCFSAIVVRGQIGPNAVTLLNGQASLDCVVSSLGTTMWTRTTDGNNNLLSIAYGCSVTGNNSVHYRTEQPGGNICRLIIINATMQQAGVYACFDGASTVYKSLVTVIDPNANVTVHNQSEVVEGDQLNISCSINYNGPASPEPSLRPSPYWTTSPGQTFTSATYHPSTTVVTLVATVTVQKPTVPIFQCNSVFEITGTTSGYNSTPPDNLTLFGNTTEIDVQYAPSTPNISHTTMNSTGNDCTLTILTCSSSANPTPSYTWKEMSTGFIVKSNSSVFSWAEDNRTYECTATNNIRNENNSSSANYTVGVSSSMPCVSVNTNDIIICSDDGHCNDETRSCGNGSHIYLTCNISKVNPKPLFCQWQDENGKVLSNTSYKATMNGNYRVLAYNEINLGINMPAEKYIKVTECLSTTSHPMMIMSTTSHPMMITSTMTSSETDTTPRIAAIVVPCCWVLLNLIAMSLFLIYYNGRAPNGKHEHKKILNNSFSWLRLMLPCVNESSDKRCSHCIWVFLFVLMSITVGLIVFPILLISAICKIYANSAKKLSTSTTPSSTSHETEVNFSQIYDTRDEDGTGNHGLGSVQDRFRPSQAKTDPSPYEDCRISIFPPSKPHPHENKKELKPKPELLAPNYTAVNKTKPGVNDQESNAYSFTQSPNNDNRFAKATVPLPPIKVPHQRPAPNPNAPLYGEIILGSQSTSRRPVQYLAEGTDAQYAPLKNT